MNQVFTKDDSLRFRTAIESLISNLDRRGQIYTSIEAKYANEDVFYTITYIARCGSVIVGESCLSIQPDFKLLEQVVAEEVQVAQKLLVPVIYSAIFGSLVPRDQRL